MDLHTFIQIDYGGKLWILTKLLKPSDVPEPIGMTIDPPPRSGRQRRRKPPSPEPA